ncbi:MAG: ABC transporter ATP-binding protein [Proteobacteria bacterium]|nr:ABC transporter ATP-binding protein [Pseudomonadota bacterium]
MNTEHKALLEGRGLSAGYRDGPDVFKGVDVTVRRGRILCLVGPNGVGKSTLLGVLAGVISPRTGEVLINGENLVRLKSLERARFIGYLPQNVQPFTAFTVRELVALGRFPHARGLGFETGHDQEAIELAMALARIDHLADRPFDEISGGERQRVLIASVLASQPIVLLLDEPTAALDIGQRSAVFDTLKDLAVQGAAVAVVTHDLNLAGLFADDLVLLADGGIAAHGCPADVICHSNLEQAYGGNFMLVARPDCEVPGVLPEKIGAKR